jgi:hypothetical protein
VGGFIALSRRGDLAVRLEARSRPTHCVYGALVPVGRVLFDPPIMLPEPPGAVVVVEFEHPVNANIAVSTISATAATLKRTSLMSSHLPVPRVAGQPVRIPRVFASMVDLPARPT